MYVGDMYTVYVNDMNNTIFASDQKEPKERVQYLKKSSLTSNERREQKQLNGDDFQWIKLISNGAYRYMYIHVRVCA